MNKGELVANVVEKTGLSKKDAEKALNGILGAIEDALVAGEKVQLVGFGTFEIRERKERVGKNPNTQEAMTIPASKAPVFKAGKKLKDAVAGK